MAIDAQPQTAQIPEPIANAPTGSTFDLAMYDWQHDRQQRSPGVAVKPRFQQQRRPGAAALTTTGSRRCR
jgi:hypothetical protein